MVGRERERRRLNDAFEQAVGDGSCQLFTVLGTAGVGKSRLVHEFLEDVAASALVARGRCLPVWRRDHVLALARSDQGHRRARRHRGRRGEPGATRRAHRRRPDARARRPSASSRSAVWPKGAPEPRMASTQCAGSSMRSVAGAHSSSSSTTSTGQRRRSSTWSSISRTGRAERRSCSSAWRGRSSSRFGPAGRAAS